MPIQIQSCPIFPGLVNVRVLGDFPCQVVSYKEVNPEDFSFAVRHIFTYRTDFYPPEEKSPVQIAFAFLIVVLPLVGIGALGFEIWKDYNPPPDSVMLKTECEETIANKDEEYFSILSSLKEDIFSVCDEKVANKGKEMLIRCKQRMDKREVVEEPLCEERCKETIALRKMGVIEQILEEPTVLDNKQGTSAPSDGAP